MSTRSVSRIVPVGEREPAPVLDRLVEAGRARRAVRPGFRPRMRDCDGVDRLGDALATLRCHREPGISVIEPRD